MPDCPPALISIKEGVYSERRLEPVAVGEIETFC
jgi:hypothetical protein